MAGDAWVFDVGEEEMNTVTYEMPLQGFRRVRGMGSQAMPLVLADPNCGSGMPYDANGNPCPGSEISAYKPQSCSQVDFYLDPAAWEACQTQLEVAQIQTVPANAAAAGYPSYVVQTAQDAANQQSAQAPTDTANIANYYGAGKLLYTPGSPNNPLGLPMWLWYSLLAVGGITLWKVLS